MVSAGLRKRLLELTPRGCRCHPHLSGGRFQPLALGDRNGHFGFTVSKAESAAE